MLSISPRRPRRVVARTLGFGMGALVAAALLTWTPTVTSGWSQGAAEATLWQLLNGARANNGMRPLQQHSTLVGLARWRSSDMLAKNYFSHTIPGCGCLVYAYYDSNGLSYVWAGENIGWNAGLDDSYSPVRVHEKFMASPRHRVNVLTAAFTHGGVGAAAADNRMFQGYVQNTRMYTQLFLQAPSAAAPAPAPSRPSQPAPAPRPSSGGGGGSGSGGAGSAAAPPAPAARAQPAPKAKPKPTAKRVEMGAPARPVSTAGLDGVARVVSTPTGPTLATHLRADEVAAARAATLAVTPTELAAEPVTVTDVDSMEVAATAAPAPSVIDGIVGAVLGFLFG